VEGEKVMRQRLPYYFGGFVVLAVAYLQCLAHNLPTLAVVVLLATLVAICAVASVESVLHERHCEPEFPEHRGWFDAEEVRAALGPQADAVPAEVEQTVEIPVQSVWTDPKDMPAEEPGPIEAAALAAVEQERAVLDDIADRYAAQQEAAQRDLDAVAAALAEKFDQAAWELGVGR
jgi:hypothetical protein